MLQFEELAVPLRIGVLADTHRSSRNARALPMALLKGLEACDVIFHAGDLNAPWVVRELEKLAPVRVVRGNNEEPPLAHELPLDLYFQAGQIKIGMMHGHNLSGTARANTQKQMSGVVDLAIYGHSHIPEIETRNGLMMVNPGSPTQRRFQPRHTFAIVTVTDSVDARIIQLD